MIKISNGRIVDPANQIDRVDDIYLVDGLVAAIGEAPDLAADWQVIDATDKVVAPGLIDLSCHVREPGFTHKATINSECQAAAASGVTTLVTPPTSSPVVDNTAVAELIIDRAEAAGLARILPTGAMTKGLAGEQLAPMSALAGSGCVAFSNARATIGNSLTLMRCLEYAASLDQLVIFQPQDNDLVGQGVMHDDATCTRLGLAGIPETAETAEVARALLLVEQTGVRAHFGQLSCERSVRMIKEARERGLPVSADVAIHHLLLIDENVSGFNSNLHLIPPLRGQLDRAGLLHALVTDGIQAICSDHQPHDVAAKEAAFASTEPGISGLETLLPLGLSLVRQGLISLPQLIEKLSLGPASILGIAGGNLAVGQRADLVIFDENASWTLDPEQLVSAGKNTPFGGVEMTGRVEATLLAGKLVFNAN